MPIKLESLEKFNNSLEEVEVLLKLASDNEKKELNYKVFNKSAILLLSAKFESFLENILDEFISTINNLDLLNKEISDSLKLQHSFQKVEVLNDNKKRRHKDKEAIQTLKNLSRLWSNRGIKFNNLEIDIKFNYGEHGEKEIIKLFNLVGICNIFEKVEVFDESEAGEKKRVDIKGKINSLIGIRNNIIHTDATPSLTHPMTYDFMKFLKLFAVQVSNLCGSLIPSKIG